MKKMNCLIIGLGEIGFGSNKNILKNLSHAHSINSIKDFKLIGGIDKNKKTREEFKNIYKVPVYQNLKQLPKNLKIDIVIISVWTKDHFKLINEFSKNFYSKILLVEKPFCSNFIQAKKIKEILIKKKIQCFINYPRRLVSNFIKIKNIIKNQRCKVNVKIDGGLINNGSHFIDLMNYFFKGECKIVKLGKIKFYKNDFSREFKLIYDKSTIHFTNELKKKKSFNIKILSKKFNISINQKNYFTQIPKIKVVIYNKLTNKRDLVFMDLQNYQKNVYLNLRNSKKGQNYRLADVNDAIEVHKILNTLKR